MTCHPAAHPPAPDVDVVVIGGGAAGLAAAIALARSRRRVVVLDAGEPRNAPAAGVHNLLSREGVAPAELLAAGRAEAAAYDVEVRAGRVLDVRPEPHPAGEPAFRVVTDAGEVTARRVVVATGVRDELPDLPGLAQRWGRDVLHCPYCHGWEVRDRPVAVLATGPMAAHQALLFRQLTDDVVVVPHGAAPPLAAGDRETLHALGVRVLDDPAVEVVVEDDRLVGLRLASGVLLERDAVVVASVPRVEVGHLAGLGLRPEPVEMHGAVLASVLPSGPTGESPVRGVWVAGNAADAMAQVMASAAAGTRAGAAVNADLVAEDGRAAVARHRGAFLEPAAWDERYAAGPVWSGRVNAQLAAEAADLAPGRALDVGSGEGGDAVWLAERGWEVTGLEFSAVGRERAAARAVAAGVADRTTWRDADLRSWEAGDERWDLVTSHFFHRPGADPLEDVRRLAAAVAPGGTLLVVGHHPDDHPGDHGGDHGVPLRTAEELAQALDPEAWDLEVVDARTRTGPHPDGGTATWTDAVLRARRR